MLLADGFVFIHQPKTGGTFVTEALRKAVAARRRRTGRRGADPVDVHKHGTCRDIPPSHRGLPVVAVFRHPWSRYVSQYHFGRWRMGDLVNADMADVRRRWPRFPDLSFPEFVELRNTFDRLLHVSPLPSADRPGFQTRQFLKFHFRDPAAACRALDDASIADRSFLEGMFPVRFLRQDRLAADLRVVLPSLGFAAEDLEFLDGMGRVLPRGYRTSTRPRGHWSEYWPDDLAADVLHRERALWALFPEYRDLRALARSRPR